MTTVNRKCWGKQTIKQPKWRNKIINESLETFESVCVLIRINIYLCLFLRWIRMRNFRETQRNYIIIYNSLYQNVKRHQMKI